MVIFLRHSFVSFLILLQFAAPLLHAHTGEELINDGIHVPGMEVVASHHPDSISFEAISTYKISGIMIDVSTGIKRLDILSGKNLQTSCVSGDRFPMLSYRKPLIVLGLYAFSPPPEPSVLAHSPRAPPY